jgi:heptosyltransferase-1
MQILFIKLGALGDVINTLPLAIILKKELNAHISWLVEPLSYPLLDSHSSVDTTICFDKYHSLSGVKSVRRALKNRRFDIILDLQRILKSAVFCTMASGNRRIGFDHQRCKDGSWLFPFERIAPGDPGKHMVNQYMEFANHLGVKTPKTIQWDIPLVLPLPARMPDRYAVLNIGATKSANRWTSQGFAGLADALQSEYNLACVLTGGPEDRQMATDIINKSDHPPINLVGNTTIHELTAVLNGSLVVATCDTGPMHLAVALGKKVVALFGPSNPERTGPFFGEVIATKLPCMPCNKRKCPTMECMEKIRCEDVVKRIGRLLTEN